MNTTQPPPKFSDAPTPDTEGVTLELAEGLTWRGETVSVDFTKIVGRAGMPWGRGQIRLETHPDLIPVKARGLRSDPGVFWKLARSVPQIKAAFDAPVHTIASAPYRLERRELPHWATDAQRATRDKHHEYCERAWHRLNNPGEGRTWRDYVREVLLTAPVCGFYWAELTGKVVNWDGFGEVLAPNVPEWRAPWAVSEWITQDEEFQGIRAQFAFDQNPGTRERDVVFPRDKVLLVTVDRVGSNFEGTSWLRSAYRIAKMLLDALQIQALSVEIHGLGFVHVKWPANAQSASAADVDAVSTHLKNRKAKHGENYIQTFGDVELDLKSPMQQLPDLSSYINQLERMLLAALQAAHQLIALQKAGSYAARSDASADARSGWNYIAQELICGPFEQQVLGRFLRENYPEDAARGEIYVPHLVYGEIETRDTAAYVDSVAKAAPLLSHPVAGPPLREALNLAPMTDEELAATLDRVAVGMDEVDGIPTPGR